jgi:invasion protein IalB
LLFASFLRFFCRKVRSDFYRIYCECEIDMFRDFSLAIGAIAILATTGIAFSQETPSAAAAPLQPQQASESQVRSVQYQDWFYRCVDVKTADGTAVPNCEVAQVKQGDKDVNVLTLAIAPTAPDPAKKDKKQVPDLLLTALVPLNIFLPSGFLIDADGNSVTEIGYRNCNEAGCWAQQKLDAKVVAALQKGTSGGARMRLMNGQNINIKFSLKGLTDALTALQKPTVSQ